MFKSLIAFNDQKGLKRWLFHAHSGERQVYLTLERGKRHPILRTNGLRAYDCLTFAAGKVVKSVTIKDFSCEREVRQKFEVFTQGLLIGELGEF